MSFKSGVKGRGSDR